MNPEEIKVGETYNVRVKVSQIHTPSNAIYCCTLAPNDKEVSIASFRITEAAAFYSINSENGIKNTEPAPKYDPCRLFRVGDIVKPCQVKGRWGGTYWKGHSGIRLTVTQDENEDGVMWVKAPDSLIPDVVEAVFFQLVTPVEEMEPYFVMELKGAYGVYNTRFQPETKVCHFFTDMHPHAKAAAEAECDRLNAEYRAQNAEYRKEQDNA